MKRMMAAAVAAGVMAGMAWAVEPEAGFVSLFNGKDLDGWIGATNGYAVENG